MTAELKALGAESVWLYGSIAKGTARHRSDVDLFVVASPDDQHTIEHRYWMNEPRVLADGMARRAHIVTEWTTHTNDAELFQRMQPEARRIDE